MHIDRRIAILGLLGTAALAVAMMAAPLLFTDLPRWILAILFWGGLLLAMALIGASTIIAYRGEASEPRIGHRRRMITIAGMFACGIGFLGFAAAYFWPSGSRTPDSTAVAQLAELGWGVQPQKDGLRFELSSKPLPEMRHSAELLRKLGVHFSIQLQSLPNLDGLHYLSDIANLDTVGISAGQFTDISEVKDFRYIKELSISQTPIDGRSAVDSSPLMTLISLYKLNLYATKIVTLMPVKRLTKLRDLYLRDTWVSDLSPLSSLAELESLDVTDIRTGDLSPLSNNIKLVELGIGSGQIPGLLALVHLQNLAKLRIIAQGNVDLGPVGALPNLEDLWVWAGVSRFDVGPLRNLTKLRKLALSVLGMGRLAPVDNIDAIGELKELRSLTLSDLQVTDLLFMEQLHHLYELNLNGTPISSLEPLRGLKQLKTISINSLPIADISPLLDLPELAELRIMRTPARADILVALERRGVKVQSN